MTASAFTGFTPDTFVFLDELGANNNTTWFHSQKQRYQTVAAQPFAAFVGSLIDVLPDKLDPRIHGEAKIGGSLFRISRDIRFSADKSPYKDHLDAIFWLAGPQAATAGERRNSPSLFVRLTSEEVLLGAGVFGLKGDELKRYRAAVAGPEGATIRRIADKALATGATLNEPVRQKPPKPYPVDHPNADLLQRDGFYVVATHDQPAEVASGKFVAWVVKQWKPLLPVATWLADQIG